MFYSRDSNVDLSLENREKKEHFCGGIIRRNYYLCKVIFSSLFLLHGLESFGVFYKEKSIDIKLKWNVIHFFRWLKIKKIIWNFVYWRDLSILERKNPSKMHFLLLYTLYRYRWMRNVPWEKKFHYLFEIKTDVY